MKLNIDGTSILKNAGYAFAGPDSFLIELIQNARRAGATKVEVNISDDHLELKDNGVHPMDFTALLTLGASGWSDKTKGDEEPFGLGFLSAIFAAKEFEVISSGKRLHGVGDDLINGGFASIQDVETLEGTVISLEKLKSKISMSSIKKQLMFFPIPVFINGEHIGQGSVSGEKYTIEIDSNRSVNFFIENANSSQYSLIYQGVFFNNHELFWARDYDKAFLEGVWQMRVPDRDKLYSSEDKKLIHQAYRKACFQHVQYMIDNDIEFDPFNWVKRIDDLSLLHKKDVPQYIIEEQPCYLRGSNDASLEEDVLQPVDGPSKIPSDILPGVVITSHTLDLDEEHSSAFAFLKAAKVPVFNTWDLNHPQVKELPSIEDIACLIKVNHPDNAVASKTVVMSDNVSFTYKDYTVISEDNSFYDVSSGYYYITTMNDLEPAIRQDPSQYCSDDFWDENYFVECLTSFESGLLQAMGDSATALHSVLSPAIDHWRMKDFKGQKFELFVTEQGELEIKAILKEEPIATL